MGEIPPAPTAAESQEQKTAYDCASQRLEDLIRAQNPAMGAQPPVTFESLIQQFYLSAMIQMGAGTQEGQRPRVDILGARQTIDARGTALAPGLIDSHVHPVAGDWTPRQNQLGWIDSTLNGGVTTLISAGEVHYPGRPKDIVGVKALAITAQRSFENARPAGVKVLAGAQ